MNAASLFLIALAVSPIALADPILAGREVLVRGFPDLAQAHCRYANSCDLRDVTNGTYPLSGNTTLSVLEDRGETLLVTLGRGTSALEGVVNRADVVPAHSDDARAANASFSTKIAVLEAFLEQPIPAAKRIAYTTKMGERTKAVVALALASGKLNDPEVENFLSRIERLITGTGIPLHDVDPYTDRDCNDKARPTAAYTDVNLSRAPISLCRTAYELESPDTFVHELTHVMQAQRRPFVNGADTECTADLVAMITVYAARLSDPSIPVGWAYHGPYYPTCAPNYHRRFRAFAQAAGIPLNLHDDWSDGSE